MITISNQPAFPCELVNFSKTESLDGFAGEKLPPDSKVNYSGMSLRDYFAAKALQGLVSREYRSGCEYEARMAYAHADAMMKVRQE